MATHIWSGIGSPAGWTRGLAAGLFVLAWGCEGSNGPAGPSPQDPVDPPAEAGGSLEVTVRPSGTRPDPDGYGIVVTIAPDRVLPARTVDPAGGTILFTDLPPGIHTAQLEGLAAHCTVGGVHPQRITIAAGETTKTAMFVNCPGPGALLVTTRTQGHDLSSGDYTVGFESATTRRDRIGMNDSLFIQEDDLPPAEPWTVRLSGVPENCVVTSPNPLTRLVLRGDVTTRIVFSVLCIQRSSRIAFDDSGEIFLTDGSESVNLTNHPAGDWGASLSPDRRRIVFTSNRDDEAGDLYVVNADGSGLTRLTSTPGTEWVGSQAWSPDGSRIVFTRSTEGQSQIYVMNADGGGVIPLSHDHGSKLAPAWSPDGASIAFCYSPFLGEGVFSPTGIYHMSARNGSAVTKVTDDGCSPAWSPDGSRIAYEFGVNDDFGVSDLAVIGIDGTGFVQLHPNPSGSSSSSFGPSWSPSGSDIAFSTVTFFGPVDLRIVSFDDGAFGEPLRMRRGVRPSWR